jgi:ribonuclease Z
VAHGDVLYSVEGFRVRGRFLDHGILCLAFALQEAMHVNVWKNRLAEQELATGHWLHEARRRDIASGHPGVVRVRRAP